jgi:hypothetical protein
VTPRRRWLLAACSLAASASAMRAGAEPTTAAKPPPPARPSAAPGALADADQQFQLDLGDGWQRTAAASPALAAWTWRVSDGVASLTRIDAAPAGAWLARDDFFAGVERGLAAEVDGYTRARRRIGRLGRVPFMDIWYRFRSPAGELRGVAMRMLFFRHYVLTLAIEAPATALRRERRPVRRALDSFRPYVTAPR